MNYSGLFQYIFLDLFYLIVLFYYIFFILDQNKVKKRMLFNETDSTHNFNKIIFLQV